MKTYLCRKKLPKLVTLISMGLATVPAESFRDKYQKVIFNSQKIITIPQPHFNKLVAIPINEATEIMNSLAQQVTRDLNTLITQWDMQQPIIIKEIKNIINTPTYNDINKSIHKIDLSLKDIKYSLNELSINEKEKKEHIVDFGRSLATYRKALSEIVSFIEQAHIPKKVTNKKPNITDSEIKKLISTEHIKLNLGKPNFNIS